MKLSWGQHTSQACEAGIQYASWLLQFQSSSLLMAQKSSRRWSKCVDSAAPMEDLDKTPGFSQAQPGFCSHLSSGPVD